MRHLRRGPQESLCRALSFGGTPSGGLAQREEGQHKDQGSTGFSAGVSPASSKVLKLLDSIWVWVSLSHRFKTIGSDIWSRNYVHFLSNCRENKTNHLIWPALHTKESQIFARISIRWVIPTGFSHHTEETNKLVTSPTNLFVFTLLWVSVRWWLHYFSGKNFLKWTAFVLRTGKF